MDWMFRTLLILQTIALLTCGGCSVDSTSPTRATTPLAQSVFILAWPNYDGYPDNEPNAVYVLNGEALGAGHAGYLHLLEKMRRFRAGARLKVEFQPHDARDQDIPYSVPLSSEDDEFYQLAKARGIELIFPPLGAGWT